MTKRVQAKYKISRRLGVNLWGREKDPFEKRKFFSGQHGPSMQKRIPTEFGKQLNAKQQLRGYYGNITEKQFRNTFKKAIRKKGDKGENFIGLLESRLDAVIYRMNFVPTVFAARQAVSHKHVTVNGKTVNIPSYSVQPGDVIEIKESSKNIPMIIEATENPERTVPEYMQVDLKAKKGTFTRQPQISEVPYPVQMEVNLVIEFYSR
ncbi:MAG TPA: 30S ribosomal protein S4 [Alphaproteobacteria bacterium]|nr:30S ribosomal protein S4 [Alphaproteobacteria bacterium]